MAASVMYCTGSAPAHALYWYALKEQAGLKGYVH